MHKSELISFLTEIGASPRKGLSQNFLIDSAVISKIVSLAEIHPGDWVLEIGPGAGAITQEILKRDAHVYAVEKDLLFAEHLERMQTEDRRLRVECGDFLEFRVEKLLQLSPQWKVISNLPYQITAPILEVLCDHAHVFESATLVVQKEVGQRIYAKPKTKTMGALTIFVQFYAELGKNFGISAHCFYPKPGVDSMAFRMNFRQGAPPVDPQVFFPVVRRAFQQRRKMLASSLKEVVPHLGEVLEKVGISPKARPEELSLEEWVLVVKEKVVVRAI